MCRKQRNYTYLFSGEHEWIDQSASFLFWITRINIFKYACVCSPRVLLEKNTLCKSFVIFGIKSYVNCIISNSVFRLHATIFCFEMRSFKSTFECLHNSV